MAERRDEFVRGPMRYFPEKIDVGAGGADSSRYIELEPQSIRDALALSDEHVNSQNFRAGRRPGVSHPYKEENMSDDRLIAWLQNRACGDSLDLAMLKELSAECRDICLRNPNGYEYLPDSQRVVFDVKLTVDAQAVVERFDDISRQIFEIDGVREVIFTEIPPAAVTMFVQRIREEQD